MYVSRNVYAQTKKALLTIATQMEISSTLPQCKLIFISGLFRGASTMSYCEVKITYLILE